MKFDKHRIELLDRDDWYSISDITDKRFDFFATKLMYVDLDNRTIMVPSIPLTDYSTRIKEYINNLVTVSVEDPVIVIGEIIYYEGKKKTELKENYVRFVHEDGTIDQFYTFKAKIGISSKHGFISFDEKTFVSCDKVNYEEFSLF